MATKQKIEPRPMCCVSWLRVPSVFVLALAGRKKKEVVRWCRSDTFFEPARERAREVNSTPPRRAWEGRIGEEKRRNPSPDPLKRRIQSYFCSSGRTLTSSHASNRKNDSFHCVSGRIPLSADILAAVASQDVVFLQIWRVGRAE